MSKMHYQISMAASILMRFAFLAYFSHFVSSLHLSIHPHPADLELRKISFTISPMLAFEPTSHVVSTAAQHFITAPRMLVGRKIHSES